ncbi:MAG: right-handed parallel beta-helix repeat-containing protein, partial [Flavobacteriales bacterium]
MKHFLLTIALLISLISSAIDIPGGDVSGVWTAENSPYVVQGDIRLNDLQTLVIEPGVEVQFNGAYNFRVKGNLLAQGAAQDSITFTNAPGTSGWKGFRVDSLHVDSDSLRFSKCKITGLYQANIFVLDGKMVLEDSRIYNNQNMYSGVFYLVRGAPIIRNCVFQNNATASQTDGGALYISDCSPLIENCTFSNNTASYSGGALSIWRYNVVVSPIIRNNLFLNNTALSGGAIVLHNYVTPIIEGNQFIGNNTSYDGGAIWMSGIIGGTVLFKDNLFENNTSLDDGGAVYLRSCRARFENNVFKGNSANSQGGGLYLDDESPLIEIEDCMFSGNSANSGGGLYLGDNSTMNINRCQLINNSATTGAGMNITYYNTVN